MSFFADILSSLFDRKLGLANRVEDDNKPIEELCQALLSSRGDVSGMTLAQLILDRYAGLEDAGKLAWFLLLANDMYYNETSILSDSLYDILKEHRNKSSPDTGYGLYTSSHV